MLELSLLGGFEVQSGRGDPIVLGTRKARVLLAYLALHPDEAVSRQSLAALLWSDRAEPQANNSVSQALSAIRKALDGITPSPLVVEADRLRIVSSAVETDVLAFEGLSRSNDLAELDRAESLYRGELLAGIGVRDPAFAEWLEVERRRLNALAVGALTRLLDIRREKGQWQEMAATAERLLKLDSLQEAAHRALMRCYAEQGQVGLALAQYETCAEILKRDLGVEPDDDTKRLREAIIRRKPPSSAVANTPEVPAAEHTDAPSRSGKRSLRWPLVGGALALVVIVAGIMLWQRPWEPREEPASVEAMAFPLPDKPSIAVMPFNNLSDDPSQEYFADGITEDLITDLSKISGLFLIARNSSFAYKGKQAKTRQVAEELGVRYVLEGSVRRAGDQVRINAQLIDATTGGYLWADRYDGSLADVFHLQDKVTKRIVDALALKLTPQEAQRVGKPGTENVEAHDAFLLGQSFYYRRTPEGYAKAKTLFERAIELDPKYSAPYSALAKMYAQCTIEGIAYAEALGVPWRVAGARARKLLAKVRGQPNADAHVVRSWLALRKFQQERAISEAEQALELSPNDVDAQGALAMAQIYAGQPNAGIELAQAALRQSPTATRPFLLMGLAEFALGNAEKAAEQIERAFELGSKETEYAAILAAAYGQLGQFDKAKAAYDTFRQGFLADSQLSTAQTMTIFQFTQRSVLGWFAEGLKLAGVRVSVGGYPLYETNRLNGAQIKTLLFGRKIEGREWLKDRPWQRRQTPDGAVEYQGYPIQPGIPWKAVGSARIEDDMLCEEWPQPVEPLELCSVIFRIPEGDARMRWGDYVMVTDIGPEPFKLVK